MILNWINKYKTTYEHTDVLEDILSRMENGDETNDIVEDFIFASKYEVNRKYLTNWFSNLIIHVKV